jgi:hypothetical protein
VRLAAVVKHASRTRGAPATAAGGADDAQRGAGGAARATWVPGPHASRVRPPAGAVRQPAEGRVLSAVVSSGRPACCHQHPARCTRHRVVAPTAMFATADRGHASSGHHHAIGEHRQQPLSGRCALTEGGRGRWGPLPNVHVSGLLQAAAGRPDAGQPPRDETQCRAHEHAGKGGACSDCTVAMILGSDRGVDPGRWRRQLIHGFNRGMSQPVVPVRVGSLGDRRRASDAAPLGAAGPVRASALAGCRGCLRHPGWASTTSRAIPVSVSRAMPRASSSPWRQERREGRYPRAAERRPL